MIEEILISFLQALIMLALTLVGVVLYSFPSIVAWRRRHPSRRAILVVNLTLGITFIGWFIALVWALTGENATHSERA